MVPTTRKPCGAAPASTVAFTQADRNTSGRREPVGFASSSKRTRAPETSTAPRTNSDTTRVFSFFLRTTVTASGTIKRSTGCELGLVGADGKGDRRRGARCARRRRTKSGRDRRRLRLAARRGRRRARRSAREKDQVLGGAAHADGKRGPEGDSHMRGKALAHGEGKLRATHGALERAGYLEMGEHAQTPCLPKHHAQPEQTRISHGQHPFRSRRWTRLRRGASPVRCRRRQPGRRRNPCSVQTCNRAWSSPPERACARARENAPETPALICDQGMT